MTLVSRRDFLKTVGGTLGSVALAGAFKPSVLVAQSSGGTGKTFVCCNLLGGFDGLFSMPYYDGTISQALRTTYRPTISINPNDVLRVTDQNGEAQKIGLHPSFAPLFNVASDRMKIVQDYGIPGAPGRSHDTCQIIMSLGTTQVEGGEMVGFLAKLMDSQNWDTFQYWSLATTNPSDTNTRNRPPVAVNDLNQLNYGTASFESVVDNAYAPELQQMLVEMQTPRDSLSSRYKSELQTMHQIVSKVRNDIAIQQVGQYDAGGIGNNLRDAAKIIKSKATGRGLDPNKDTIILVAQGGYDYHGGIIHPYGGNQITTTNALARNLATFYQDLISFGVLDKTIIALYSEFGRTVRESSTDPFITGTDHGHGNNTIVFGGPIRAGVIGNAPSMAEISSDYNALFPSTDYRDIFSSVFTWMGINPQTIFSEPYTPRNIGLI